MKASFGFDLQSNMLDICLYGPKINCIIRCNHIYIFKKNPNNSSFYKMNIILTDEAVVSSFNHFLFFLPLFHLCHLC